MNSFVQNFLTPGVPPGPCPLQVSGGSLRAALSIGPLVAHLDSPNVTDLVRWMSGAATAEASACSGTLKSLRLTHGRTNIDAVVCSSRRAVVDRTILASRMLQLGVMAHSWCRIFLYASGVPDWIIVAKVEGELRRCQYTSWLWVRGYGCVCLGLSA